MVVNRLFELLTVSTRIVTEWVKLYFQVVKKLKKAATLEFATKPAIIFIDC